jgi:DNA-binding GntR family transcriptional regulator
MRGERRERTLNAEIFERIRADILAGRLLPGERLKSSDLCEQHGVSLSVVREALTRLTEQGLARAEPQAGFRVTPLSRDDLIDVYATRIEVESLTVRHAVSNGDMAWESSVVAAHHTLQRTNQYLDGEGSAPNESWPAAHKAFHRALINGCGRPRLIEITESLWDASELYRRWATVVQHDRDVADEHAKIAGAVVGRDADLAAALLAHHLKVTLTTLLDGFPSVEPPARDG